MNDSLIKACRLKRAKHTPIWIMRQAGRYLPEYRELRKRRSLMQIFETPEICSDVMRMPVELFGLDAAVLFADIMLPLKSVGVEFELQDNVGPVIRSPIRSREDAGRLKNSDIMDAVPFVYDTIKMTKEMLDVPIIGFCGAPFTLASYLIEGSPSRDFKLTKNFMHANPSAWRNLMGTLTSMSLDYLNMQISAGVGAIQLFDTWVGCLSSEEYREFVQPYSKTILGGIAKKVPRIHFGVGTGHLLEQMRDAGADVIGIDWRISLSSAWAQVGYDVGIQGNLDPSTMLLTKEDVRKEAERIMRDAGGRAGHIFNLGHGILPGTPLENVSELVKTVHEFESK
ncbi:MAG: uroporphyrinogen decarboxylase [Candidatus Micrarchaeota archaeon]|nr:uroporphyrinogen decarboxylase [Candidatus Micrarchaeota archaeon]